MRTTVRSSNRAVRARLLALAYTATASVAAFAGGPAIDIVGIRLGESTLEEAKAALTKVQPPVRQRMSTPAVDQQRFPGYVARLEAASPQVPLDANLMLVCPGRPRPGNTCDTIRTLLTQPPNKSVVAAVERHLLLGDPIDLANMTRSLTAKYGQPGWQRRSRISLEMAWVWNAEGKPTPLNDKHPCRTASWISQWSNAMAATSGPSADEQRIIGFTRSGCARMVYAQVHHETDRDIVTGLTLRALDAKTATESLDATRKSLQGSNARIRGAEDARARATPGPKL